MSTTPPTDNDRTQVVPPPSPAGGAAPQPAAAANVETDFDPTMIAPRAAQPQAAVDPMAPTQLVGAPASVLGAPVPSAAPAPGPTPMPSLPPAPKAGPSASSAGDSGNALPVGTYLSEFELTGVIGEGGFGIVYHAWDHSLQRKVALKEYMPSSLASREGTQVSLRSLRHKETFEAGLKSFINEARLLAQYDHPSLVKVYRFWEANGTAYMVMPLYEGVTLKDKLRQMSGKPDENWLKGILAPLTEALSVIHKDNVFHRDIAPDNVILLSGSERPLLLDFGAARRVIGDMTQALTVILKPGYAPVEQYAESPDMKQGSWTDVYALAATIHWAIMGKTPPPSVSRLMNDSFQPLSKTAAGRYSERFLTAIDRALAVRPEQRTPSIAAFRADVGLDAPWAAAPAAPMPAAAPLQAGPHAPMPPPTMPGMPGMPLTGMQQPGYPPGQAGYAPTQMAPQGYPQTQLPPGYPPTQMAQPGYPPTQMAQPGYAPTQMPGAPGGWVPPEQANEVTMMAPRNAQGGFDRTQMAMQTRAAAEAGMLPEGMVPARTPAPPVQAGGNKTMLWIGLAVALLAVGGVGGYLAMNGKEAAPTPDHAKPDPGKAKTEPPAPTPPPPAPAPAPPPATFNAREQFDRVVTSVTAGRTVEAIADRSQLSIKKRDKLVFDVMSNQDGYLHVLARGPDGSLTVLFPNDKVKEGLIKAGQRTRLPHKEWPIEVGEPAGTEQLLVIVSAKPRDFSYIAEEKAFDYRTVPVGTRANALLQQWNSQAPILLGKGPKDCQGPSCDEYGAAMFSVQVTP